MTLCCGVRIIFDKDLLANFTLKSWHSRLRLSQFKLHTYVDEEEGKVESDAKSKHTQNFFFNFTNKKRNYFFREMNEKRFGFFCGMPQNYERALFSIQTSRIIEVLRLSSSKKLWNRSSVWQIVTLDNLFTDFKKENDNQKLLYEMI